MATYAARTKAMFQKYGRVAVGVHFAVYGAGLATCYVAVERGFKVEKLLQNYGLLAHRKKPEATTVGAAPPSSSGRADGGAAGTAAPAVGGDDDHDERSSWWARTLAGSGSSLALAFICNKALFPVRAPITLGLTPMVARALRARGLAVGGGAAAAAGAEGVAVRGSEGGGGVPPPTTAPPPPPPPPPPPRS